MARALDLSTMSPEALLQFVDDLAWVLSAGSGNCEEGVNVIWQLLELPSCSTTEIAEVRKQLSNELNYKMNYWATRNK